MKKILSSLILFACMTHAQISSPFATIDYPTVAPTVDNMTRRNEAVKLSPVNVILDTDMGGDIDDAGDLALLNALADSGYVNVLAVTSPVTDGFSVQAIDILQRYFGRNVPVGKRSIGIAGADGFGSYLTNNYHSVLGSITYAENAKDVMRKVLAGMPNASVTLICVGPLGNLYDLYNSTADSYSTLSGAALMQAKIARVVIAAGYWPNSSAYGNPVNNFTFDPTAAVIVNSIASPPLSFVGDELGNWISTGGSIRTLGGVKNPLRDAWDKYFSSGANTSRPGWGQVAVLKGVLGNSDPRDGQALFTATAGTATVTAGTGANSFSAGAGNHEYLTFATTPSLSAVTNYIMAKVNFYLTNPPLLSSFAAIQRAGDTNIPGKIFLENATTNAFGLNTNQFYFDPSNGRAQLGAMAGIFAPPGIRLNVNGSNANNTVGREKVLTLSKPQSSGTSFAQAVTFEVGRFATHSGDFDPKTEFGLGVKSDLSVALGSDATYVYPIRARSDASVQLGGSVSVASILSKSDGSASSPSVNYSNEADVGWFRPGADTEGWTAASTERFRLFTAGIVLPGGANGAYWATGALGATGIDVGIERAGANTLEVTVGVGGALGNLNAAQYGVGATANIRAGTGTPEGVVTATVGSLYLRTDGGANTTLYVKESGAGNTGWIAK